MAEETKLCHITMMTRQLVDNESEKSFFDYEGTFLKRGSFIYVTYTNKTEDGETKVLIKCNNKSASVIQSGALNSRMVFDLDQDTLSPYATPVGTLNLTIHTCHYHMSLGNECQLDISYDLLNNGILLSHNDLVLKIK